MINPLMAGFDTDAIQQPGKKKGSGSGSTGDDDSGFHLKHPPLQVIRPHKPQ